ncbi:hypothetical protein F4859DRAFT_488785 [Xylaria cf. heliscus]|nr:hypothetical protein F4859DRAFT_488785 [Xylaria cf. heliscus]
MFITYLPTYMCLTVYTYLTYTTYSAPPLLSLLLEPSPVPRFLDAPVGASPTACVLSSSRLLPIYILRRRRCC